MSNGNRLGTFYTFMGILGVVSLGVTVLCSYFGAVWLESHDMTWLEISLFGLTFLLFGIAAKGISKLPEFKTNRHIGSFIACMFILAGAGMLILPMVYGLSSPDARETFMSDILPIALTGVFPLAGTGIVTATWTRHRYYKTTFTQEVEAEVADKLLEWWRNADNDSHASWRLVWRYCIKGEWITWRAITAKAPERRDVGDHGTLYINPENPYEAYDKDTEAHSMVITTVVGTVFIVIGLAGVLFMLGIIHF